MNSSFCSQKKLLETTTYLINTKQFRSHAKHESISDLGIIPSVIVNGLNLTNGCVLGHGDHLGITLEMTLASHAISVMAVTILPAYMNEGGDVF
jgi:hypothetical protein